MGTLKRTVLLGVVAAALTTVTAHAADMPRAAPVIGVAPQVVQEFGSGWYLRGDIGYSWQRKPGGELVDPVTFSDSTLRGAMNFGLGIGYKQDWFRTDFTVDYRRAAEYTGSAVGIDGCEWFGSPAVECAFAASGRIDSLALLWNVYFDLGTWGGFTPYVGAGIGTAHVRARWNDGIVTNVSVDPAVDDTSPYGASDRWNLAWALMAGTSYALTANTSIDFGYRYINLGRAQSAFNDADQADGGSFNQQIRTGTIAAHEMRVGLRYMFD
jgi:opacity protein-like surface antigen